MDGYRDMPIEEMVRIEDKVDLSNCPNPNRSYKIPRALLPSLEKFIDNLVIKTGWDVKTNIVKTHPVRGRAANYRANYIIRPTLLG
jgi:hypothetical protein